MEAYAFEWLNLLVRWLHVITGIAWIGASFYFVWLDNHLEPPTRDDDIKRDVSGELWAVHGGGFYHAEKFRARPPPPLCRRICTGSSGKRIGRGSAALRCWLLCTTSAPICI